MQEAEGMFAMDRRALMRSAIMLVGGSVAGVPAVAFAQDAEPKQFFTPPQFYVLDQVSEIMIPKTDTPGAREAGVPGALDMLMTKWASQTRGEQFRALMDDIDLRARAQAPAGLRGLSAPARLELVRAYDAEKMGAQEPVYRRFKELVLTLYYLSEVGATQELRYELVPGKWEPWTTIGADARAWAV